MNTKSVFLTALIFIYIIIIECNELAPCYNQPPESCPLKDECKCVKTDESALFCCQVQSNEDLLKNFDCTGASLSSITALHVYNMTADYLNFGKLTQQLSRLISFSITNSFINRIHGRLENAPQISCLNFSKNTFGTEWQDPQALENLKSLVMLDFSNVNISSLPIFNIYMPHFWLDISNTTKIKCESLLKLMKNSTQAKRQLYFAKQEETFCTSAFVFHWFNSTEKVAFSQVQVFHKLSEDCPLNCNCSWYSLDMVQNTNPVHSVKVDCSNRQLSSLPENLPENTVFLNVTNNNITNLDALTSNETYKTLRFFYADENKITNITTLEGSYFMYNFAVLSLKLNQLKFLPIYILQNAFIRSELGGNLVFLGGNELKCDCSTALLLKVWLLNNRNHIVDFADIFCENLPYKSKVIDLEQKLVCATEADWTYYMYYIIAAEISLLLLLIGKVSYDYWVFKTAGYLPWPASKMPKLPCDWVFE